MKAIYSFKISLFISIFFILSNLINAQVVYTDIIPDYKISEGNYNIDINNDGEFDMSLEFEYTGDQYQQNYSTYLNSNNNVSVLTEVDWMTTSYISLKGDTIGPNSDWQSINKITTQLVIRPSGPFIPAWNIIKEGFLAIRIKVENQYHYGYLRLYYNDYYHYYLSLADFVYCSTPNCEIITGLDIPNGASSLYTEVENTFYDGRDITVSFTKAIDESLFSEYKVFIARSDDENADNMEFLNQLSDEFFISIPTGSDESFLVSQTLSEQSKSIDGELIKPYVDYRIHIINLSSSGEPSQTILSNPSSIFRLIKPLETINKVIAMDINNTASGEDIKVIFSDFQKSTSIQEYRVFIVNKNDSEDFTLETALQLSEDYYTSQIPTSSNYEVILNANQLTTSGGNIIEHRFYTAFVLSLVEEGAPMPSSLSPPSRMIRLTNPNSFYAGQKIGEDISWYTYDTILSVSPVWGGMDEQHHSGVNYIDVNRDGQSDFKLYGALYESDGTISFDRDYYLHINGERNNSVLIGEHEYYNHWLDVLQKYEAISQDYQSSTERMVLIRYSVEEYLESGIIVVHLDEGYYPGIPNVAPDQDYYIGLEINDAETPQYAWIKLNGYRIIEYGFQDFSSGLSDIETEKIFKLSPNPTHQFVNITAISNINIKSTLKIVNSLGSLVDEFEMNNTDLGINIENYPAGLYYIQISNSDGLQETHKLIIR